MTEPHASAHALLTSLKFCVIDLETTGGSPERDEIFEIGLVRIENLAVTEERSMRINPGRDIPDFVQRLTGVKTSDVASAPRFEEIADEVTQFAGDCILVAHNTSFDVPFLNAKLLQAGRPALENKVLCTNVMTKYMIPDIVNSNLEYMGNIFNLGEQKAHRAIEDARTTAKLLLKYLEIFEQKDIRKVNQLYYPRNRFELDRHHFERSHQSLAEVTQMIRDQQRPLLVTAKGEQGVIHAILPLENPARDAQRVEAFLRELPWTVITVRLIGPYVEALMQLNAHYLKIPEATRTKTLDFLRELTALSTQADEGPSPLEHDDFLVVPHLIQGQLWVYSLMGLTPFSQLVFKFPAHRKKLTQFLTSQVGRFEQQKGKRRHQLLDELRPFVEHHLRAQKHGGSAHYLFLSRDELKQQQKVFFAKIDKLVKDAPDLFQFPARSI